MSYSDYIIVGGGASGCALASQLLKHNNEVSLFESGYPHHNFLLDVPAGFFKLINNSKYLTYHKSLPQKHLGGRENIIPQGHVLGGGTSVNSQVYMRGRPQDYNEWEEILRFNNDTTSWGWDNLLPYFKNMENNSHLENEFHGNSGPLMVSDSIHIDQVSKDFIKTVEELGVAYTDDFNGSSQKGVGYYQFMNRHGKRSSAAYAFITPEKNNKNLQVNLNSTIEKIIIEKNKAIGVEYRNSKGELNKKFANKEIILTNGSTVYGKIKYQDQDVLHVETLIGELTIQRNTIKRVIENVTQAPDSTDAVDQTRQNEILEIKRDDENTIFKPTTKLLANSILLGDITDEVDFRGNRTLRGDIKNIGESRADFVKINFVFRMNWQGSTKSLTAFVQGSKHVFPESNIESDSSIEVGAVAGFRL